MLAGFQSARQCEGTTLLMTWTIDIAPMVPAPLFWSVALAVTMVLVLIIRRSRGALLRALSLAALLSALAIPRCVRRSARGSPTSSSSS